MFGLKQIWVISTHLKWYRATDTHNLECVKI